MKQMKHRREPGLGFFKTWSGDQRDTIIRYKTDNIKAIHTQVVDPSLTTKDAAAKDTARSLAFVNGPQIFRQTNGLHQLPLRRTGYTL